MLKLFYDKDTEYFELFYKKAPNYGVDIQKRIIEFRAESNDKVIGYGFYRPLNLIPACHLLEPKIKIAALCFIKRKQLGLTERELAAEIGMSYRTYQRIEEGLISKIDDLIKVMHFISDLDVAQLLKVS
jgi:DNA-binding XRE family transcriptional regulator